MCTWSTVHRVLGCLPPEDGYGEIAESWHVPAGEATNGAILMSAWGEAAAQVEARVTIGAGDAFRAGIAYGILHGFGDEAGVEFALAAAGCVCSRGPIAAVPPRLDDIAAARALAL
jgi:sugar/nucleoside kinase (ribokinase family)